MGKYSFHHTALSVRDIEQSIAFYKVFGFEEVHRYVEPDGSMQIVHLKLGSAFLELFAYVKNESASPVEYEYGNNLDQIGVKHIALQVDDVEAALQELRAQGLADESTEITVGRTKVVYFFIKDPDGVWVEVLRDDRYK